MQVFFVHTKYTIISKMSTGERRSKRAIHAEYRAVWERKLAKTASGLTREDLVLNSHGVVVSKKKQEAAARLKAATSAWRSHLARVREANPGKSLEQAMVLAKSSYKKKKTKKTTKK
jgi:hypothetical protein